MSISVRHVLAPVLSGVRELRVRPSDASEVADALPDTWGMLRAVAS